MNPPGVVSKGKWLPGSLKSLRESHGLGYTFYCEVCDRGFPTQVSFEKHNQTEMHFKRMSKSLKRDGINYNSGLDLLGDLDRMPNQRARRNIQVKNYSLVKENTKKGHRSDDSQFRCPTCFALFDKNMMGKHLLSYFHCQKSERAGRHEDPEMTLILNNIHSIVTLSPYQCKPCKFYFTKSSQLLRHFEEKHAGTDTKTDSNSRWICSVCTTTKVTDANGMLNHLKNSVEHEKMEAAIQKSIPIVLKTVKVRKCSHCVKTFLLRRELISHERTCSFGGDQQSAKVLRAEEVQMTVEVPTETTSRKSQRLSKQNSSEDLPEFKCDKCPFSAKSQAHLLRHLKVHEAQRSKEFTCEICGGEFYEKYQLNYHMKIHGGKTVRCDFLGCNFHGRSHSEVKLHSAMHQSSSPEWKCDKCKYQTAFKSHLRRHIKLTHDKSNEKNFKCKKCPYETNLLHGLKRHLLSHEETKTFQCPYCKYTAKSIETLRTHVLKRKFHPDAFLYSCLCCSANNPTLAFRTNKFSHFKSHAQKEHPDNASDSGIYILAGLRPA